MSEHLSETELNDLIDGRLAPDERSRAEAHLAECARCARERVALAHVVAAARSARGSVTAPPELWALVAASTIHERLLRRHVLRSMRGVLLLAALVLVAATIVVTAWVSSRLPSGGPPPPRPPAAPRPPGAGVSDRREELGRLPAIVSVSSRYGGAPPNRRRRTGNAPW